MRRVLGLNFSMVNETELARTIVDASVPAGSGPRVVATANLDHIVNLAENDDLRGAYSRAWVVTADGMPVFLYARLRGLLLPARLTGADLCRRVLAELSARKHRCFFLAASAETADKIRKTMLDRGFPESSLRFSVPPFGFERDAVLSAELAECIKAHGTTHLFLGVGSPKSEVWTDQFRARIGDCYVLNVGAGLDFFAGTKLRAPAVLQRTGLEWAWRFALEPRRLFRRYFVNSWRFLWIVGADLARREA